MHQGGTFPDQEEDDDEEDLVMSSRHRIDDPLFRFGQYKEHSYRDVAEHNAGYFFWAKKEKKPSAPLQNFIDWVEVHYLVDEANVSLTSKEDGSVTTASRFPRQKP